MANFILDDFKRIITGDNPLSKIIVVNVVVFLITELFGRFIPIVNWLALPGDAASFLLHFWSIITYMFFTRQSNAHFIQYALVVLDWKDFARIPGDLGGLLLFIF